MGNNTTVVILNDALHAIAGDPEFGKNLARAIASVFDPKRDAWVPAGNHCNAAYVVETHHADYTVTVNVGGNRGEVVTTKEADSVSIIRRLARALRKSNCGNCGSVVFGGEQETCLECRERVDAIAAARKESR